MRSFGLNNNAIFLPEFCNPSGGIFNDLKNTSSSHHLIIPSSYLNEQISITTLPVSGVAPAFHVDSLHAEPTAIQGSAARGVPTIARYFVHGPQSFANIWERELGDGGNRVGLSLWP